MTLYGQQITQNSKIFSEASDKYFHELYITCMVRLWQLVDILLVDENTAELVLYKDW